MPLISMPGRICAFIGCFFVHLNKTWLQNTMQCSSLRTESEHLSQCRASFSLLPYGVWHLQFFSLGLRFGCHWAINPLCNSQMPGNAGDVPKVQRVSQRHLSAWGICDISDYGWKLLCIDSFELWKRVLRTTLNAHLQGCECDARLATHWFRASAQNASASIYALCGMTTH